MGLSIRMAFYFIFGGLAGYGVGSFDIATETYSITVGQIAGIVGPIIGFGLTFLTSRWAKSRGGLT